MDKLILLSQSSLATEQYTVNGVVKNLHYVIKKHPIEFEFALESKPEGGRMHSTEAARV